MVIIFPSLSEVAHEVVRLVRVKVDASSVARASSS